jgi:hypothetical protein
MMYIITLARIIKGLSEIWFVGKGGGKRAQDKKVV